MKLIVNSCNFGVSEIESSNFGQDVFTYKETKRAEYFFNKNLDKVCDIDLIFEAEVITYKGHICGGGQGSISIDRQSARRTINITKGKS